MHFRFRTLTVGDHTHVRVFVGNTASETHANVGQLTMHNQEWYNLYNILTGTHKEHKQELEFVNDEVG